MNGCVLHWYEHSRVFSATRQLFPEIISKGAWGLHVIIASLSLVLSCFIIVLRILVLSLEECVGQSDRADVVHLFRQDVSGASAVLDHADATIASNRIAAKRHTRHTFGSSAKSGSI